MITVGKQPSTLVHGDGYPASFYVGDKMVAGYEEKTVTGDGVAGTETQYNGNIPSAVIQGVGRQETLTGRNKFPFRLDDAGWKIYNHGNRTSHEIKGNSIIFKAKFAEPIDTSCRMESPKFSLLPNHSYKLSCYFDNNNKYGVDIRLNPANNPNGALFGILNSKGEIQPISTTKLEFGFKGTVTLDFSTKEDSVYQFKQNIDQPNLVGENASITVSDIRITDAGEKDTSYEPYCGGIPAPNPDYPIEPEFLDGASLVSRGRNLFDGEFVRNSYINQETGRFTTSGGVNWNASRQFYAISPNKSYTINYPPTPSSAADTAFYSDANEKSFIGNASKQSTFVPPDGAKFMRFTWRYATYDDNFQVELGEKTSPYEPYFNGGTVNVPVLRQIPRANIRDEYDAQTGKLTRRIKEKVFDGSENWKMEQLSGVNFYSDIPVADALRDGEMACSHSRWNGSFSVGYCKISSTRKLNILPESKAWGSDASLWAKFLQEQYAKGTPLTIWYTLAEPIIEQYDPAKLKQHPGYTQLIQQGGFAPAPVKGTFNVKKE